MKRIDRSEIQDWVTYSEQRQNLLPEILRIKHDRRVHLGTCMTFLFENADTLRYQIQEMLRVERIVREADIQHELDTYNELVPGQGELSATLLIEIDSKSLRDQKLREWINLPKHLYILTDDGEKCYAEFDERQVGDDRLSSVQYLKFTVGSGLPKAIGCDLPQLDGISEFSPDQRQALIQDLQSA